MRILYVSAGRPDRHLIKALGEFNHIVEVAKEGGDALVMAGQEPYGTIILDGPRPSPERVAAFASVRPEVFLILIVETGSSEARAEALRAGADACFTRPIHIGEIGAKLDALARRADRSGSLAAVELLPRQQAALVAGDCVALSRREYLLLEMLARRPGEVISTRAIIETVWGGEGEHDPAVVRTCLARLRRKIEPKLGFRLISAVRGLGYSLSAGGPI